MTNPFLRPEFAADHGFTIVDTMVALVAALAVAGALMAFLVSSGREQNTISSQTFANRQAEAGLAQLVHDLREAQNNQVAVSATYPLGNRTPVVITYTTGASANFTASFYVAPTGGCDGTASAPCTQVTWICTAASGGVPGKCTRNGVPEITGLASATITPSSSSGTTITTAVSGTPPGSPATFPSFVQVALSAEAISQSDTGGTHTVSGSSAIPLQSGVNLRNWS